MKSDVLLVYVEGIFVFIETVCFLSIPGDDAVPKKHSKEQFCYKEIYKIICQLVSSSLDQENIINVIVFFVLSFYIGKVLFKLCNT